MRLFWLFIGLALLVLIPFFIWGGELQAAFTQAGAVAWLRDYGSWAWLAGIGLITVDLVLPIPATVVMSALGYLYGVVWGGVLSAAGSFIAGALAYGLCRQFGTDAARRLLGKDYERGAHLFAQAGGWIVALSRWTPVLPEVVTCMAGLTRMPAVPFFAALACGSIPLGFTFAAIGYVGTIYPMAAIGLSALVPAALWLLARPLVRKHTSPAEAESNHSEGQA